METETAQLSEKLNTLIASMDLPIGRKDSSKPETTRWLFRNMGVRNSKHKNYEEARSTLVKLGQLQHVLSTKEARHNVLV